MNTHTHAELLIHYRSGGWGINGQRSLSTSLFGQLLFTHCIPGKCHAAGHQLDNRAPILDRRSRHSSAETRVPHWVGHSDTRSRLPLMRCKTYRMQIERDKQWPIKLSSSLSSLTPPHRMFYTRLIDRGGYAAKPFLPLQTSDNAQGPRPYMSSPYLARPPMQ